MNRHHARTPEDKPAITAATIVGTLLAHGVIRLLDKRKKQLAIPGAQSVSTDPSTTQENLPNG